MKKTLILAAAAALALAACSKNEITVNPNRVDEKLPIGFSNYTPRAITKAAAANYVDGTTLKNGATFSVYAWSRKSSATLDVSGAPDFMSNVIVTYNGDTGNGALNTYSPMRYWPSGDDPDLLTFFSYYPQNGAGITAPANGLGEYTFTAQGTDATMVDFLIADVVKDQKYGATNGGYDGTVKFNYKHQLTRVGFKFKKAADVDANTVVKITSAKLVNIQTTGKLTASYNAGTNVTSTEWSNQAIEGSPKEYTVFHPTEALTTDAAPATVANDNLFLMIPQTMTAKNGSNPQYLEITWTVQTGSDAEITNTKKLYLDDVLNDSAAAANIDWEKNMSVTYTITVGPKPIWFTAAVGTWDDPETNGYYNVN